MAQCTLRVDFIVILPTVHLPFSFLSGCWFVQVMKKFAFRDWCLEQRFMALLLPLILLYNNPLFPLNFLTSSWLPGTLDGFFQVSDE